jgi:hypothetical protein
MQVSSSTSHTLSHPEPDAGAGGRRDGKLVVVNLKPPSFAATRRCCLMNDQMSLFAALTAAKSSWNCSGMLEQAMPHVLGLGYSFGKRAGFDVLGMAIKDVLSHFDDTPSLLG